MDSANRLQLFPLPRPLLSLMAVSALIFLGCSTLRHGLFRSTVFDLGIYDQVTYLISQGQSPLSSILGFHHLGNHAAWAVYPLALLYKLTPNVHWLLLVQVLALAIGTWPVWNLSRLSGLSEKYAGVMALVYLLYPVIFNVNLFDFHPEVMALPAILGAILAAKLRQVLWFTVAILWVVGCKAVLSLTVAGLGFWLLTTEKRRVCGVLGLIVGVSWFLIATQKVIPAYSGSEVAGVWRYTYLGDSVLEILVNLLLKPGLVLGKVFAWSTLQYLLLISLPVIWGVIPLWKSSKGAGVTWFYNWAPLMAALPTLVINILSDVSFQRSLSYQYSLPVIPFLLLVVIQSLSTAEEVILEDKSLLIGESKSGNNLEENPKKIEENLFNVKLPKLILLWSLLMFLVLAKPVRLLLYFQTLDTWQASRIAITQVPPEHQVLTDNFLGAHLSQRPVLKLLSQVTPDSDLTEFDTIILNLRHPWPDTQELGEIISEKLTEWPGFELIFDQDDVKVWQKNSESTREN